MEPPVKVAGKDDGGGVVERGAPSDDVRDSRLVRQTQRDCARVARHQHRYLERALLRRGAKHTYDRIVRAERCFAVAGATALPRPAATSAALRSVAPRRTPRRLLRFERKRHLADLVRNSAVPDEVEDVVVAARARVRNRQRC